MVDVWQANLSDVDEMVEIATARYDFMDKDMSKRWVEAHIEDYDKVCIVRSKNVICCVAYSVVFWKPRDLEATVIFFAAKNAAQGEALAVIKDQMARAKNRGCWAFYLGATTGIDFGPFAKRLGMSAIGMNYGMEF